jgi:23S rRNA (guanosine2251-2'-O)-methyltransferase
MQKRKSIFVFGINPVLEKLRHAPGDVYEISIVSGSLHPALRSIALEARALGLPVRFVDYTLLRRLSASRQHQGVVAQVAEYAFYPFEDALRDLLASGNPSWILVLDGVTDPRNFGAMLRTAEAVGIGHVVIPEDRAVGVTPTVVKSSVGAVNYLKISRVTNLRRALLIFKKNGFWVVGLDAAATQGIYGRSYPEKLVVVLGSEGSGIRPLIRRECDVLVSVPMRGRIGSLNVAVAAGVFFYELLRQQTSHQGTAGSHDS